VQVGSLEFDVAQAGEGGRPLLLVHGFGGAKEDFGDFLADLAGLGWHAVAPDLRGHGGSARAAGEDSYSFELFVADVVGLADALGWDRFVLLGHSMGGMVAQQLVLAHPERVDALILMGTSPGPPEGLITREAALAGAHIIRTQGLEAFHRLADPLGSPSHQRLVKERPGYAEFCEAKALSASADMRCAMLLAMVEQADRLEALRELRLPVLVIDGVEDTVMRAHGDRLAATITGARRIVIDDAGHSPQFENASAWWAAVSGFLDSLKSGL
jgi:pimeloyl-ACP methyl ester carboxylesterase